MHDFTTKPLVATRLGAFAIPAGTVLLKSADFESLRSLEETHAQVATLVADAKAQADHIRAEARKEGLEQGLADAQKLALGQVAQMQSSMNQWVAHTDDQLIDLVGRCVMQVVDKIDPSLIARQSVEKGLAQLVSASQIVVRVHPSMVELMETQSAQVAREHGITGVIRVVPDGTLKESDVLVESPIGSVDLRLEHQLQLLSETLKS